MKEIYLVQHASNESCKCDFIHDVISAHETMDGATAKIEQIAKEIANKTSHYFNDREFGWINTELIEDSDGHQMGYERYLCYAWTHVESCVRCYTKFYIKKIKLYED